MTDDAHTAAEGRERKRKGGRMTVEDYELQNHQVPQELEHVQRDPMEICSQEVHEVNGIF